MPTDSASSNLTKQLQVLMEVIDAIASMSPEESGLSSIYSVALNGLQRALGIERASILLFDPDGVMRFKAWLGISDNYRKAAEGHTPWPRDTKNPPPLIVPDVHEDPTLAPLMPVFAQEGVRALAFIPLVYQDNLLGKFMLYSREPNDFKEQTEFAVTLGRCIAFAIVRYQIETELRAANQKKDDLVLREQAAKLESEKAIRKYAELVDTVDGIVWEMDANMRFTFVSKRTERILGYPISQWLEEPGFWAAHIHPEDRDWCVQFCAEQSKALLAHKFEYRFITADGRTVWLRDIVSVVLGAEGELAGLRGIMIDVTDRKLHEQRMREESERNVRLRDDFISVASHELKTPLTAIRLQFQLIPRLLQNVSFPGKEKVTRLLQNSLKQLDQFLRLSEELLDMSRIGAGRLELQREDVALAEMVSRVVAQYQPELSATGCSVVTNLDERILGHWDSSRVEQILVNLLTNAMKFGAGKPIEIITRQEGKNAELIVRDHGIGLAKEDQEKIFERFERAASVSKYRGLGLGLYITRQVVVAHGGTIRVESEPGQGATFVVTLPLAANESASTEAA